MTVIGDNLDARVTKYLATCEPAISGQRGHDVTLRVACAIGPGFNLTEDETYRYLCQWNATCQPPWSEPELRRKVSEAFKVESRRGWIRDAGENTSSSRGSAQASTNGTAIHAIGNTDQPIVNRAGFWTSCLHNSLLWLAQNGYGASVRYDRFRHTVLVHGAPLDDAMVVTINAEIEASRRSAWSQEHVRSALMELARRNEFSSLTAWLDLFKWDGVARLDQFFPKAYGAEATDYTAACAKVLFISGVARAYQPGCQADVMVVLIGPQGLGKSMGIASLCPDPTWYADDLGCDLFDRKAGEGLRGKWLIEFSEFSRINRATLDVAKAFVSRRSDYYRPAYGRIHKDYPRTCVFVGTTNDDHPLHDRENRRFMPVHCVKADTSWITSNRDQLWAEAVSRYRGGEQWWVTVPTLLQKIAEHAEEARQADSWIEILDEEIGHMVAISMRIAADALKIRPDQLTRAMETRIGLALKALGYTRKRVRTGNGLAYEWRK
jgi:predicted P-loop ATPase